MDFQKRVWIANSTVLTFIDDDDDADNLNKISLRLDTKILV